MMGTHPRARSVAYKWGYKRGQEWMGGDSPVPSNPFTAGTELANQWQKGFGDGVDDNYQYGEF